MQRTGRNIVLLRSNEVSPDPRVEKEARALHNAGWNVQIVAWDRSGVLGDEQRDYAAIHRVSIKALYGTRFRNVPRKARFNIALLKWLLSNRACYTHIHACDFDTVLPALVAKRLFGKKVVFDIYDFTVIIDDIKGNESGLKAGAARVVKSLVRKCELGAVNASDAVILPDECRVELLCGANPKRVEYVYNSPEQVDTDSLVHGKSSGNDEFVIAYVGALYAERGIFQMLDVVAKHPEFTMHIAGFGHDEEEIAARADELCNVHFHGKVDYNQAMSISANADVLFATYDTSMPCHRYSSANKLFESMMLGKPIIVARHTGMDRVVEKHALGKVVEYGNTASLEKALIDIAAMSDEDKDHLAQRAKMVYEQHYSWAMMRSRLVALYDSI